MGLLMLLLPVLGPASILVVSRRRLGRTAIIILALWVIVVILPFVEPESIGCGQSDSGCMGGGLFWIGSIGFGVPLSVVALAYRYFNTRGYR